MDEFLQKSKEVHSKRIVSLELGKDPIKSLFNSRLFKLKLNLKIIELKNRKYFVWRFIKKAVKRKYPYYLSRHYYKYNAKQDIEPKIKKVYAGGGLTPWEDFNNQTGIWSVTKGDCGVLFFLKSDNNCFSAFSLFLYEYTSPLG